MKKTILSLLAAATFGYANAQIVINEIDPTTNSIELKNLGTSSVDVSDFWLCDFPKYTQISSGELKKDGSTTIAPGGFLVISGWTLNQDAELGLYNSPNYGTSSAVVDYVEWGSNNHQRSATAVAAGTWTSGDFLPKIETGESIEYDGSGDTKEDYAIKTSTTLGSENSVILNVFDFNQPSSVVVFPNPTVDFIKIDLDIVSSLRVMSLTGKELMSVSSNEINVESLTHGTYIVEVITTNDDVLTSKIIKK